MRISRVAVALALFTVAAACGGGGGGGDPVVVVIDLGMQSSTAPTSVGTDFTNPLFQNATVVLIADSARFTIGGGVLPLAVTPNETFQLPVVFQPIQAGVATGSITLEFQGQFQTVARTYNFSAEGEAVSITVLTAAIDYGEVLPGTTKDETIQVQNLSTYSAAHASFSGLPTGGFQSVTPLPLEIAPGATETITLRYAPIAAGAPSGNALVSSEDTGGPYPVQINATTGGQETTDFGNLAFDTGAATPSFAAQTAAMNFVVPPDAVSFTVEAYCDANTQIALSTLTGPGGENFEDENFGGIYLQYPDFGEFAALVPNADQANQQIIPGTWTVRIGRLQGGDTDVEVRVIIERRPGNNAGVGTIDMNVFLANAISPTAATAPNDATMTDIWSRVSVLLSQQGIVIGDIDYYDITDTTYDDVTGGEFPDLLALSANATEERFNYFFVRTAIGGGVLGVSAKLGGTTRKGSRSAGVMGLWIENPSAGQADLVARVTAHEMGHYLGLRHTAEQNGSNDRIDDTTNFGSGGGGTYLMHWNAGTGGSQISNGQGLVIRGHAHVRARLVPPVPLVLKPQYHTTTLADVLLPKNWCGTCERIKSKHELGK